VLLGDVVALGAHKYGDRAALVYSDRETSFRDLHDRCKRLANALTTIASRGDRVSILSQNRPEYVEAYFGVPMAGMALNFLNYRLAPRELARIIADAEASVLLCEAEYLDTAGQIREQIPSVKTVVAIGDGRADVAYEALLAEGTTDDPHAATSESDLAWLIYTSGTTGMPKGAMLSHRNVMAAITSWLVHSTNHVGQGVQLMPFPLCHIAGVGVVGNVLLGVTLVLRRAYEPEDFMTMIERYRVTAAPFAPTMLNMLLQHPDIDQFDLSSLRTIAYGGASMPVEVLRRAMTHFPQAEFVQGFGMTELAGNVLFLDPDSHRRAVAERPELLAAAGRSMALSALRLVDDDMNDVPVGSVGEIVVRGDQVMSGYWRRPEANEDAFFGGWFHTGDLGRADEEGYVAIVDRKKDMIVTGGENVYGREVEDVIYGVRGVAEAAVFGVPDPHWGENVCAAVVTQSGVEVSEEDVIGACRANLAGYKKPKQVIFVDELPRNASGKILKRELRHRLTRESPSG
jgi:acyl-CoA synthetase (AMP-forming)/AMP-acid ligase II